MTAPKIDPSRPGEPSSGRKAPFPRWQRFLASAILALFLFQVLTAVLSGPEVRPMSLDEFLTELDEGRVVYVEMHNTTERIDVWVCDGPFDTAGAKADNDDSCTQPAVDPNEPGEFDPVGTRWQVKYPYRLQETLAAELLDAEVRFDVTATHRPGFLASTLQLAVPLLLIIGLIMFLSPGMMRGSVTKFQQGQGKLRTVPKTRFSDVAGAQEVVAELGEIVDFFDDPERYRTLGASPPKGVLLVGPPGTGKTLLARAVAGEARVPFFALAGSDFVEVFAGAGAARVRQVFAEARKAGRAIVFIDEIDAVGKRRSSGPAASGGHDEREQTLNQLLVELDGFDVSSQIFVLAATNRADTLDPALLRSGRFDRQIEVPVPDRGGREQILALHSAGHPVAEGVDLGAIAAQCPGFSGADLANLCNQAALFAAREPSTTIEQRHFQDALYTLALGRERRSRVMTPTEKRIVAYHEAGHAVAAYCQDRVQAPARVTIVPRGHSGGQTWIPQHEEVLMSKAYARAQLVVSLAGRAAEELEFGSDDVTQGASADFQAATRLAREMVCQYGMTDFGIAFLEPEDWRFSDLGPAVHAATGDLLAEAQAAATELLVDQRDFFDAVAAALLDRETLDRADLDAIAETFGLAR